MIEYLSTTRLKGTCAMSNVIALTSGKGGAGKTTFAVNIAAALAAGGARTVLLDLNVGTRNADIYLGLENKVLFDLADVLSGVCTLEKATVRDERFARLSLLSPPQYKLVSGMSAEHIRLIVKKLRESFDYVIIDCPGGLDRSFADAASAAEAAVIIATADYSSVRSSEIVERRLAGLGVEKRFLAVNMYYSRLAADNTLPDIGQIKSALSSPLIGTIAYDTDIHVANNTGCPVICEESSISAKTFLNMARQLAEK